MELTSLLLWEIGFFFFGPCMFVKLFFIYRRWSNRFYCSELQLCWILHFRRCFGEYSMSLDYCDSNYKLLVCTSPLLNPWWEHGCLISLELCLQYDLWHLKKKKQRSMTICFGSSSINIIFCLQIQCHPPLKMTVTKLYVHIPSIIEDGNSIKEDTKDDAKSGANEIVQW